MRRLAQLVTLFSTWAAPAQGAGDCHVSAQDGKLAELRVDDLEGRFPELHGHLRKGLSATLLTEVEVSDGRFTFGCRIFFDLWDESYLVLPIVGVVEVKERQTTVKALAGLPPACTRATLPWQLGSGKSLEVVTRLNPVTDEQVAKTRKWLAERGIGAGGALAGRAAYAMVDLKQTRSFKRRCTVR